MSGAYCLDCRRYGVEVQTIRLASHETALVCADTADCTAARAASKAAREAEQRQG